MSRHEPADVIIPTRGPKQQLNLLELLMAGAGAGAHGAPPLPETESPFRLYADDLSYLRAAFDELAGNQPKDLPKEQRLAPEWHEDIEGFRLVAPPDLQQRYAYLPPELKRTGNWKFTLSADRARVQAALQKAREESSAWPEVELLWELHPIAGWINDRMVCHFGRHEAPVIRVDRGLGKGEWVYVFQGVLSNQHSQPVLVDWFGVRTVPEQPSNVVSLSDLSSLVGLSGDLVNSGDRFDDGALRTRLRRRRSCFRLHAGASQGTRPGAHPRAQGAATAPANLGGRTYRVA